MSRVRLAYALALLGILITTGGCAESATAPEATLRGADVSAVKGAKPEKPAEPVDPTATPEEETTITTMDSGWMTGGGRAVNP